MGREVRMVPADWQHPKVNGRYAPLLKDGPDRWDEKRAKWYAGLVDDCRGGWVPKSDYHTGTYEEWAGERPSPDDCMPEWPADQRTHLMMYENTSEGTPISPAFAKAEDLARWLADNDASSFGSMTATYEQWLSTINRGWAVTAVMVGGVMRSGVEEMAAAPTRRTP